MINTWKHQTVTAIMLQRIAHYILFRRITYNSHHSFNCYAKSHNSITVPFVCLFVFFFVLG